MTLPVTHTAQTGFDAANTTTTTATLDPAKFSDGDTVFIAVCSDAASQVFTAPTGFTSLFGDVQVFNNTATGAIFYKRNIVKASETFDGVNYDFAIGLTTSERQSWVCWAVTGDIGSFDGSSGTPDKSQGTTATVPFLTTTRVDGIYFGVVFTDESAGITTPMTPFTLTKHGEASGTSAGAVGVFYETAATVGTYPSGNQSVTLNTTEQWAGVSFVVSGVGSGVNVGEAATLAETVTTLVGTPAVNPSNSITLTDTPTLALASQVRPSDAATLAETVTLTVISLVSVTDTATLAEVVTLQVTRERSVTDTVTTAETVTLTLVSFVDVSSSVTVAEAVSLVLATQLSTSDAITLGEIKTVSIPGVTPTQVNLSDAATLAETVTLATATLTLSVADTIAHTETVTLALVSFISVTDAATLAESVTVRPQISISVADAISASEAKTLTIASVLAVSDTVTHTETVSLRSSLSLSVANMVALAEANSFVISQPDRPLSVSDSITVGGELVRLFMCVRQAKTTKFMR